MCRRVSIERPSARTHGPQPAQTPRIRYLSSIHFCAERWFQSGPSPGSWCCGECFACECDFMNAWIRCLASSRARCSLAIPQKHQFACQQGGSGGLTSKSPPVHLGEKSWLFHQESTFAALLAAKTLTIGTYLTQRTIHPMMKTGCCISPCCQASWQSRSASSCQTQHRERADRFTPPRALAANKTPPRVRGIGPSRARAARRAVQSRAARGCGVRRCCRRRPRRAGAACRRRPGRA